MSRVMAVTVLLAFLFVPSPGCISDAQAGGCTTCTSVNNVSYCTSGNVAELCQTTSGGCTFSGGRNCGGSGCFLPTTSIITSAGIAPISSLAIGDRVLAEDDSGSKRWATVLRTIKTVRYDGYYLINGSLGVTGYHPFRVVGKWVLAQDLQKGDALTLRDGSAMSVSSAVHVDRGVRVYNIDTGSPDTFFANGILVHNKDGDIQG